MSTDDEKRAANDQAVAAIMATARSIHTADRLLQQAAINYTAGEA